MARFRLNYLLLILISFLLSLVYESRLSSVLFISLVILSVLSFIVLIINYFFVSVDFSNKNYTINKGQEQKIIIEIKNKGFMPLLPLEIIGELPVSTDGFLKKRKIITTTPPFKKTYISFMSAFKYRGVYQLNLDKIYIYDMLKLFKLSKKINISNDIIVLPRIISVNGIKGAISNDKEMESQLMQGFDKSVFSSIREYRQGDLLQSVHWKLSAKQDELLVKQYAESLSCDSAVVFDYSCDSTLGERAFIASDAVVETVVAISHAISAKGDVVNLFWEDSQNAGKLSQGILSEYKDFYSFYQDMSYLPFKKTSLSTGDLVDLSQVKYMNAKIIYIVSPWFNKSDMEKVYDLARDGISQVNYFYIYKNQNDDASTIINELKNINISQLKTDDLKLTLDNLLKGINLR